MNHVYEDDYLYDEDFTPLSDEEIKKLIKESDEELLTNESVKTEDAPCPASLSTESAIREFATALYEKFQKVETDEEKDIKLWLNCTSQETITINRTLPYYYVYQTWKAIPNIVKVDKIVSYSYGKLIPLLYTQFKVDHDRWDAVVIEGHVYCTFKSKNIILKASKDSKSYYLSVVIPSGEDNFIFANQLIDILIEEGKQYSPLIKKKLEYTGQGVLDYLSPTYVKFDNIILDKKIVDKINNQFIYPLTHRDVMQKAGLPLKRGILLEGKPGTGKTLFGKALMNEVKDSTIIFISGKGVSEAYDVSTVFKYARDLASYKANIPVIVYFEDIDLIGLSRESNWAKGILGELLTQLDGVEENDSLYTVATTNDRRMLDQALSNRPGRFDVVLTFSLPELPERRKLVGLYSYNLNKKILEQVVHNTTGLTPAQIREVLIKLKILEILGQKINNNDIVSIIGDSKQDYVGKPYS